MDEKCKKPYIKGQLSNGPVHYPPTFILSTAHAASWYLLPLLLRTVKSKDRFPNRILRVGQHEPYFPRSEKIISSIMVTTRSMKAAQRRYCSPTLFDKLPAELRDMVWHHAFSSLEADIEYLHSRGVCHLKTLDGFSGQYYPHPLLYSVKRYSSEIREMLYKLVAVRLTRSTSQFREHIPRKLTWQIRNLKITASDLRAMSSNLMFSPLVEYDGARLLDGVRHLKGRIEIARFPNIAHLQIDWTPRMAAKQHRWDRDMAKQERDVLVYFIEQRKNFSLTIDVAAREYYATAVALRGTIVDGSLIVHFKDGAQKDASKWEEEIRIV